MRNLNIITTLLLLVLVGSCISDLDKSKSRELIDIPSKEFLSSQQWYESNRPMLDQQSQENSRLVQLSKTPDWEYAVEHQLHDGRKVIEVYLNQDHEILASMEDKEDVNAFNTLLFFPVGEMEYEVYISRLYKYGGDKVFSPEDLTRYNFMSVPEAFSGIRMLFDWDEKPIGGWEYTNGDKSKIIKRVAKKQQDNKKANDYQQSRYDNQDSAEDSGTSSGGGSLGYECEYEVINWYQVNPYGDDYYLDSDVYLECRFTEEAPVPEESSPNGGGYVLPSNGNGPNPPQTDEACYDPHLTIPGMVVPCVPYKDDDYKIINNLTGKAACVYDKLMKLKGGFKSAIQKFDGEFPVAHLRLDINNSLSNGIYGITGAPNNYTIPISMSNNQLEKISDLGGAIAFAHEVIHAEIYRKMLSAAERGDLVVSNMSKGEQLDFINNLRNDFPGLYDYYLKRYKPTWDHNMMAAHYRSTLSDIAEQFDNKRFGKQIYDDISWAGLRILGENVTSIAWDSLDSDHQDRILLNLKNHFHNGTSNCK